MIEKEIYFNRSQFDFIQSDETFSCFMGGYKAGKTHVLAYKGALTIRELQVDGIMAEPTYRMNEDLLRPALERAFENLEMWYKWNSSESLYQTRYGNILLRTQDKRNSLEGHNIGWFGLDEVDLIPNEKALENWRVLISKLTIGNKQFGFCCGTNEGFEFIYNKFYLGSERISDNTFYKLNHKLFKVSTKENLKNLPDGYIDRLYENYDEKLVQRYIEGEFVNVKSGRAYSNFSDDNKIEVKFDPNKPIIMSWDVNYSDRPMSTTILQHFSPFEIWQNPPEYVNRTKDVIVAVAGFYNKNTNTEIQCQIIDRYLKLNNFNSSIRIYGDRTGHDRRVGASRSHYQIVSEYFRDRMSEPVKTRSTRSIIDRVTAVQTLLKNARGERRLFIDKSLQPLITDFEQTIWKTNANELDASNLERTDPTDSISYYCYYEFDITKTEARIDYL